MYKLQIKNRFRFHCFIFTLRIITLRRILVTMKLQIYFPLCCRDVRYCSEESAKDQRNASEYCLKVLKGEQN